MSKFKEIHTTLSAIKNELEINKGVIIDVAEFEQLLSSIEECYCCNYDIYTPNEFPLVPYFNSTNIDLLFDESGRALFECVSFCICNYYDYSISIRISLFDMYYLQIDECIIHS